MNNARKSEPEEAKIAFREQIRKVATQPVFVNRTAVIGMAEDLVTLVFGFSGGFPDGQGEMVPGVSAHTAVIMKDQTARLLLKGLARRLGVEVKNIDPDPEDEVDPENDDDANESSEG